MKIILIGRYGEGEILAGPERVARELYAELKTKAYKIIFVEYFVSGYKNSSLLKKLIGRELLADNSIIRLGIFPMISFFLKEKFDLLHIVNSQRFMLIILLLKSLIKFKLTATLHGFIKYEIPYKKYLLSKFILDIWLEKVIIKKADLLIFPSTLLYKTFSSHHKISPNKCIIIPNGVSSIFSSGEYSFPQITKAVKLVFYNGFSEHIKNGLNELVNNLRKINFKIELYVLGRKVELHSFKNIEVFYVRALNHAELIEFLKDKHFVIKSSAFDSFSIFAAELMSLGLIPITNSNIGINEFVEHRKNGFIYNNYSTKDLSNLLNNIFINKYDLNQISLNTKNIGKLLNWKNITEKYVSAYKSII